MNDTAKNNQVAERDTSLLDKVSKPLIIVGALAFGFIIFDRVENMLKADDLHDVVEVDRDVDRVVDAQLKGDPASSAESVADVGNEAVVNGQLEIEGLFGSRLVLVSESEDPYVVTAGDRRIAVGEAIDDQTTLAGVSRGRVMVSRSGDLITLDLPELQ